MIHILFINKNIDTFNCIHNGKYVMSHFIDIFKININNKLLEYFFHNSNRTCYK